MEFTINQVAELLEGRVDGNGEEKVFTIKGIEEGTKGSISFLSNPKYEPYIYETESSAVIVKNDFQPKKEVGTTLIFVDDPYTRFTTLLEQIQKMINPVKMGVESPSYQCDSAIVGNNIYRGAFSYIGERCKIGNNVKIYPNAFVGDDVEIGDNTILYSGVKIYPRCKIGQNCTIQAGAVIGSDGFGFAPQEDGTYKTIPQLGTVIIEDNVDIGANTVIDRATFDATVIKKGVKLDNLIQVAHNVVIGKNTVAASQSGISGSTKVGENCVIAGQAGIVGHLKIADKTTIAAQAGVTKSIKEAGSTVLGSPAIDIRNFRQSFIYFKKLPELVARITKLEKKD
ncbi:UDP-3-O-(3-hydroxymyristoyl)glucosamine N-acyltransferase [Marinigracilibium pacificum]|uniref:UDP-3-O-acylglucosamine N-acyltransferase n=1 Tax=Marinigracilibium pacificum TaxID=2729599 RepID=A0A848IW86_9BACT|nr:UDP-3-O-(3-hydroxymyristoyl)glucosamine N-acyltransferase [Marinigracilibium pacificum]NMM48597.1 UDP-3-O-(3-hydroxymyristoyl)glucosamine N-acyltransferase [Marinigracilibium pacificum]